LHLDWPRRIIEAIQVGADLKDAWPDFAVWLLVDPVDGVVGFTNNGTSQRKATEAVAQLYIERCSDPRKWEEANSVAWAAERAAAGRQAEKLVEIVVKA
jgi:hypothetical protein